MSNLQTLLKERNKRQATTASKVTDTEAMVKKLQTLENSLKGVQKERDELKAKFESFQGEVTKKTVREKILGIATAKNAVDPEDILYRFESKVKMEADRLYVDGSEKTLDEDIEAFLSSKPHLVKTPVTETAAAGGSSGVSPFPASAKPNQIDVRTDDGATQLARSFMPPTIRRQ